MAYTDEILQLYYITLSNCFVLREQFLCFVKFSLKANISVEHFKMSEKNFLYSSVQSSEGYFDNTDFGKNLTASDKYLGS